MSVANKSIVFLALAFAVSWGVAIGGWALGVGEDPTLTFITFVAVMAGPAVAALICAAAFEKGRRVEALGLRFKPNWWWLLAYLIPIVLCVVSVAATLLFSDRTLGDLRANLLLAAQQSGADVSQIPAELPVVPLTIFQALVIGAAINSVVLTFTEELGWRGYLHDLWRRFGFWRASLATGAVWGVWHAPVIYLFGHNYPTERVLGVGLFTIYCILLAPLLTLVRDRGGSVWAAGILHGTLNAVAGLTILWLSSPDFPWNGIVGIGGFIALTLAVAVVFLLQRNAKPAPAPG